MIAMIYRLSTGVLSGTSRKLSCYSDTKDSILTAKVNDSRGVISSDLYVCLDSP